jgi:LysM repeat protein
MMTMKLTLIALVVSSVTAHLEINLVAGPSVKVPEKDKGRSDKTILSRTAIATGTQQGIKPNDPSIGAVCHNSPMLTDANRLATLTAGGDFTWGIQEKKLGSGHDGGQCSWWVSDGTDQKTWYKFNDDIDCTANAKAGNQPGKVKIPKNLPLSCKTACTIMWLWAPLHSGTCEIYSDCFDVKITGVTGGIKDDYPAKTAPFECIRVNTETSKTSAFGKFINVAKDGSIALEKVVDGDQNCYQYTVRDGDSVDLVVQKFDLTAKQLFDKNPLVMSDQDSLPSTGTKLIISGCGGKELAAVNGSGSLYMGSLTALLLGTLLAASIF